MKGLARGAGDAPVRGDVAEFSAHAQEQWKEAVADTALHLPPALVRVVFLFSDHELFSFFNVSKTVQVLVLRRKKTDEVRVNSDGRHGTRNALREFCDQSIQVHRLCRQACCCQPQQEALHRNLGGLGGWWTLRPVRWPHQGLQPRSGQREVVGHLRSADTVIDSEV